MASTALRTYVARSGSSATNSTTVAMVAATAKSVVAVLGSSADSINLLRVKVSFDGVTPTAIPALVEIGVISALGTVTSFTPVQHSGVVLASAASAGYNATVEPTYVRIIDTFYVPVYMGLYEAWVPLGEEAIAIASQGFAIRVTAPATVNCHASVMYGE